MVVIRIVNQLKVDRPKKRKWLGLKAAIYWLYLSDSVKIGI